MSEATARRPQAGWPRWRWSPRWIASAWLFATVPAPGQGLLVDPWLTPAPLEETSAPGQALPQVDAVYLLVFANGQTLYPSEVELPRRGGAAPGSGALGAWVGWCRRHGAKLYYVLDLLRWRRGDVLPGGADGQERPEWAETDRDGTSWHAPTLYASPFQPQVQEALRGLVREVATLQPAPDGLLLNCRLGDTSALGYSAAARRAYIEAQQRDPLDLVDESEYAVWHGWREATLTALLEQLVGLWRQACPTKPALVWTTPVQFSAGTQPAMARVEPWGLWLDRKVADGVVMQADWARAAGQTALQGLQQLTTEAAAAGRADLAARLRSARFLVPTSDGAGAPGARRALDALRAAAVPADRWLVYVCRSEDWSTVVDLLRNHGAP